MACAERPIEPKRRAPGDRSAVCLGWRHGNERGALSWVDRPADRLADGVQGWMALTALALFGLFTAVVLPVQAEAGAFYTSRHPAPDTSLWYLPTDLYAAAEAWGQAGRDAYVLARLTFDVIWPLVYGSFLLVTLSWTWATFTRSGSRWRRVALLPVVVVALDYAENVCTALVMARFPARTPVLAELAPLFTLAKWVTLSACFVLLGIGLVLAVVMILRGRRAS